MHLAHLGLEFCWVPLFCKHASRMRSSATSTYHAPMSRSPTCAYYMHGFALFLRVSKMLYGTASGDEFGTPWARILLGFCCFASMPHGRVHRPCQPTRLYVQLSAMRLYIHAFAVFLGVSKMLYGTASGDEFGTPWARILLGFCCFASMPHGRIHRPCQPTRLYMSSYPPCAYISMIFHVFVHAFAVFLRVSKMLYGTASGDEFGTPWARILLGFCCFASMPHGRVHRPCQPTRLYVQLSAMRLYIHAFAVFLQVSKMLYGTASRN